MELTQEYFDKQIKTLSGKLDGMDSRISSIAAEVANVKQDTTSLREDVEAMRADMPTRADYNRLQQSVDAFAKHYKDHDEEMTVLQHHDEATQKWIKVAAPKIGVEYSA